MTPQTLKILQDKANAVYPDKVMLCKANKMEDYHNAVQAEKRKAYLAGCNDFIDVFKDFNRWAHEIAWYDEEYGLWNLHDELQKDSEYRLEHAPDQFRFDDEEFIAYFLIHINTFNRTAL